MESPGRLARVDELDGLRGLLALWVVVSHIVCLTGAAQIEHPLHLQSAWQTFSYAQPAVETFMILSGFAISFLLHARPQTYTEFIGGRFFRIVPIYLCCLSVGTWVAWSWTPWFLSHAGWRNTGYLLQMQAQSVVEHQHFGLCLASHVVLLHGLIPSTLLLYSSTALLPPAWSISVEWQYYLVAPWIAKLVRSNLAVIALLFLCFVLNREDMSNSPRAFLLQRLDLFLLGIGSYHLYAIWKAGGAPRPSWAGRLAATAFVVGMLSGTHSVALQIWVITFGAGFVAGRDRFSKVLQGIRAFLLWRSVQYLGRFSYPLYLVHWPLLVIGLCLILRGFPQISGSEARIAMLFLGLPITVGVSAMLHYTVELPFMRLGRQVVKIRPVPHSFAAVRDIT